jgi:hypothetical protein
MLESDMETWMLFKMAASFFVILGVAVMVAWGILWAVKGGLSRPEDSALETLKKRTPAGRSARKNLNNRNRTFRREGGA